MFSEIVALTTILSSLTALVTRWLEDRKRTRTLEAGIDQLERKVEEERTVVEYVKVLLELASERQRLATFSSERSARNLFWIGTILTVLSVCAPFALVALYIRTDTIGQLRELKQVGLDLRVGADLAKRDWHLLVAGVSFGLLFLAAARGVLAMETRQRELYARESRAVTYYGDLIRALQVAARLDEESKSSSRPETMRALRAVLAQLLSTPRVKDGPAEPATPQKEDSTDDQAKLLKGLLEPLIKPSSEGG